MFTKTAATVMISQLHPDCDIASTFCVEYDSQQCNKLVVGFYRTESKQFVIPKDIQCITLQYVESIRFEFEANEDTLSRHFERCRISECQKGLWYINIDPAANMVPFQIQDVRARGYRRRMSGFGTTSLSLQSPFSITKQKQLTRKGNYNADAVKTKYLQYLLSHLDGNELVCFDRNYEQIYWKLSDGDLNGKARAMIKESEESGQDLYAIVLETYSKYKDKRDIVKYVILRRVVYVQTMPNLDEGGKSQKLKPTMYIY